ncbi:MAG: hypothetical protein SGPRY_008773 [Prymnesium sp.]
MPSPVSSSVSSSMVSVPRWMGFSAKRFSGTLSPVAADSSLDAELAEPAQQAQAETHAGSGSTEGGCASEGAAAGGGRVGVGAGGYAVRGDATGGVAEAGGDLAGGGALRGGVEVGSAVGGAEEGGVATVGAGGCSSLRDSGDRAAEGRAAASAGLPAASDVGRSCATDEDSSAKHAKVQNSTKTPPHHAGSAMVPLPQALSSPPMHGTVGLRHVDASLMDELACLPDDFPKGPYATTGMHLDKIRAYAMDQTKVGLGIGQELPVPSLVMACRGNANAIDQPRDAAVMLEHNHPLPTSEAASMPERFVRSSANELQDMSPHQAGMQIPHDVRQLLVASEKAHAALLQPCVTQAISNPIPAGIPGARERYQRVMHHGRLLAKMAELNGDFFEDLQSKLFAISHPIAQGILNSQGGRLTLVLTMNTAGCNQASMSVARYRTA